MGELIGYVEAFRRNYADALGTGTDSIYQNVYGMWPFSPDSTIWKNYEGK